MTRKTKADLEAEVADLQKRLIECETKRINEVDPPPSKFMEGWMPAILLAAVLGAVIWFQQGVKTDPEPTPVPDQTIEAVIDVIFSEMSKGYAAVFVSAADKVKSGEIKTDQQLFDYVQPALVALRIEKQRPFDQIFNMSLPRGDDGTFAGKEAEVEEFLRRIAKSW